MADYLVRGNRQPSVAAGGEQQVAGELSKDITALEGSQAKEKRRRTGKENWERATGQTATCSCLFSQLSEVFSTSHFTSVDIERSIKSLCYYCFNIDWKPIGPLSFGSCAVNLVLPPLTVPCDPEGSQPHSLCYSAKTRTVVWVVKRSVWSLPCNVYPQPQMVFIYNYLNVSCRRGLTWCETDAEHQFRDPQSNWFNSWNLISETRRWQGFLRNATSKMWLQLIILSSWKRQIISAVVV